MERRSASRNPGYLQNTRVNNNAGQGFSSPTTVKREFTTPAPIQPGLASSVAQSLSSYEHVISERRHRSVFASLAERCTIFKDVPNTSIAPTLVELARDAPGVPLYITSPEYPNSNFVRIPPNLLLKLTDTSLKRYLTFGVEKMRRKMTLGIFKFLLWQCNAVPTIQDVSRHSYSLDWEGFVQLIHSSGHRLVNLPARALYPNGLPHSSPHAYPSEVLDDVIRQFAHPEPRKRFGVISRCHDTDNSTLPLMSKISCTTPEDSTDAQPIEWSAVGRHAVPPITSFASTACRCNLCVDSLFGGVENRLGKQLVASSDTQCNGTTPPDPLQAAAQWEARWELTHEVFDVSQLPSDTQPHGKALSNSISIGSVSTIFDGLVLPSGVAEGHWDIVDPKDDEVIPGVLASGRFIPTFVAGDLDDDEDSTSVYKATTDNAVEDSMSDTSSSDSELSSSGMLEDGTSSDPTETLLDIPSLRSAEIEWDVEDFEIERKRVAEDVDLKRRRDEEDRVREVERKRRRITLEAEYSLECFAREREEEDRRREEARRKQDEELRARLRARLEAIH